MKRVKEKKPPMIEYPNFDVSNGEGIFYSNEEGILLNNFIFLHFDHSTKLGL